MELFSASNSLQHQAQRLFSNLETERTTNAQSSAALTFEDLANLPDIMKKYLAKAGILGKPSPIGAHFLQNVRLRLTPRSK